MDRKLAADADFFWSCVEKRAAGGDIRGASGRRYVRPTAAELFGSADAAGANGESALDDAAAAAEAEVSVSRSGVQDDVRPALDFASLRSSLPAFAYDNLVSPERMRYAVPTPVQSRCVPLGIAGRDVLACAQTGSGKTVGFLLPLIASISTRRATATSSSLSPGDVVRVPEFPADCLSGGGTVIEVRGGGWYAVELFDGRVVKRRQSQLVDAEDVPKNGGGDLGQGDAADPVEEIRGEGRSAKEKQQARATPSALILAPTRELALQIELEIEKLTFGAPPPASEDGNTRWCAAVYGGATARPQLEALASGAEIVVATPGRLADFLGRDLVSLARCSFLVLDEADRMLDMGFEPELRRIVEGSDLPGKEERQTLLFSATFPKPLQAIARRSYLRKDFARIEVGKVGASNADVEQRLVRCDGAGTKRDKLRALLSLLEEGTSTDDDDNDDRGADRTIVFVNKKHHATWLAKELAKREVRCSQVHGGRTQGQRETALGLFRDGGVDVLVATDAVARGIDVPDVAHVVQFDLPISAREYEAYTHRIGRTGRAGRTGVATAIYVPGDAPKLGNAELWPLLRDSFDETNALLPDWFKDERGGGRGRSRRESHVGGSARTTRSPRSGKNGGIRRKKLDKDGGGGPLPEKGTRSRR